MKAHGLAAMVLLLSAVAMSPAHAEVRSLNHMSAGERIAMLESQDRLAIYDREMIQLESQLRHTKISRSDYNWKAQQLTAVIREESLYQNSILLKKSDLPQRARELLETVEHVAIGIPVGVAYLAAYCVGHSSGFSGSFSP